MGINKLPKIPVPLRVQWREFRVGTMPYLIFAGMLGLTFVLWGQVNRASTTAGVGEGVRSTVTSPYSGRMTVLNVRPYQVVQQGDPIAIILPVDVRANLDLWRGEVDVVRMRLQPSLAEQNSMSFERLRLELAGTKSELAIAKVNLQRAENELARNTPLYQEKLVSEDIYDLSLQTRNALQAEVTEKSRAVAEIDERMKKLRPLADPELAGAADTNRALIDGLESRRASLATNWGPVILAAPITGMVGPIFRQQGENIVEGEPLVTIYSLWADHVVAYLRQPYVLEPQIGMKGKITSRNKDRAVYDTQVIQVGAQVEVITNALAFIKPGALVDVGLPVVMELPESARVRAGETVDVFIEDSRPKSLHLFERLFFK